MSQLDPHMSVSAGLAQQVTATCRSNHLPRICQNVRWVWVSALHPCAAPPSPGPRVRWWFCVRVWIPSEWRMMASFYRASLTFTVISLSIFFVIILILFSLPLHSVHHLFNRFVSPLHVMPETGWMQSWVLFFLMYSVVAGRYIWHGGHSLLKRHAVLSLHVSSFHPLVYLIYFVTCLQYHINKLRLSCGWTLDEGLMIIIIFKSARNEIIWVINENTFIHW